MGDIGQALFITLGLLVVSLIFVGLAMWGIYKFFSNNRYSDADKFHAKESDNKLKDNKLNE